MPRSINDAMQRIKTTIDNDSIMFVFGNSSWAEAYDRTLLYKDWGDGRNYYSENISPRIISEGLVNLYYKNTNGGWINLTKYNNNFAAFSLKTGAVNYYDQVKIDPSILPRAIFTDSDKYIFYIDEQDGSTDNTVPNIYIDELNTDIVKVEPYSLDDSTLASDAIHMMNDIKVTVKDIVNNTMLVWLNGVFVPIMVSDSEKNVFFIKNGMQLVGTKVIEQTVDSKVTFKQAKQNEIATATVIEDEDTNVYRYDFNIRLFKWKNTVVSNWISPVTTLTTPIVHNYTAIYIIKSIIFDTNVNKNAHMIFENGVLLDPDEYIIDPSNPKKVILKNIEIRAYNLLRDVLSDMAANPSYYEGSTALEIIQSSLTEKKYSLVNFSNTDTTKTLYIRHSKACMTDFPYRGEITFSNVNIGDLIFVDGVFSPYEWVHKYTISYPLRSYTFNSDAFRVKSTSVTRISFILK